MQINVTKLKDAFQGQVFNKNRATIFTIISVVVIVACFGVLVYVWSLTKRTMSVCMSSTPIIKNQLITANNIKEYKMTMNEFYKYALQNTSLGYTNRIVEWKDRNSIINKKYSGYSLIANELIMYPKLANSYVDNSRLMFYSYPGKNIVELDISNSNLETYKNMLRVGDKINISCSYDTEYQLNLSLEGVRRNNNDATQEVTTTMVENVFTGIMIADILNTNKESLLDYQTYLQTSLSESERQAVMKTDEYTKKTKVSNLLLAMTPDEEKQYRIYSTKDNIKFYISLPQMD